MIVRAQGDIVDDLARLHDRVRALETGAHPRPSSPGGVGRNTEWARLAPAIGAYLGGAEVFWRVRSDTVYFKTTGGAGSGVTYVRGKPLFQIGRAGRPAAVHLFSAVGANDEAVLRVGPSGIIVPVYGPAFATIRLRQGFTLG